MIFLHFCFTCNWHPKFLGAESSGIAEVESIGKSKPTLPSSCSPRATQEPTQEQPAAVSVVAKLSDSGHQKLTDDVAMPVTTVASQTGLDEEPAFRLTPEHGRVLRHLTAYAQFTNSFMGLLAPNLQTYADF